jgi:hypothetical protein
MLNIGDSKYWSKLTRLVLRCPCKRAFRPLALDSCARRSIECGQITRKSRGVSLSPAAFRNGNCFGPEVLRRLEISAVETLLQAVVLFSPDDLARLRPELLAKGDGASEKQLRGQPRPNVFSRQV